MVHFAFVPSPRTRCSQRQYLKINHKRRELFLRLASFFANESIFFNTFSFKEDLDI